MAGTMMHYLAGAWTKSLSTRKILNPYNDHIVAEIYEADANTFVTAIDRACAVSPKWPTSRFMNGCASCSRWLMEFQIPRPTSPE